MEPPLDVGWVWGRRSLYTAAWQRLQRFENSRQVGAQPGSPFFPRGPSRELIQRLLKDTGMDPEYFFWTGRRSRENRRFQQLSENPRLSPERPQEFRRLVVDQLNEHGRFRDQALCTWEERSALFGRRLAQKEAQKDLKHPSGHPKKDLVRRSEGIQAPKR